VVGEALHRASIPHESCFLLQIDWTIFVIDVIRLITSGFCLQPVRFTLAVYMLQAYQYNVRMYKPTVFKATTVTVAVNCRGRVLDDLPPLRL
jgi:hypothetical protein